MMLPKDEIDSFLQTVADAVDLAEEGKAAEGYTHVLLGLHDDFGAASRGHPGQRA